MMRSLKIYLNDDTSFAISFILFSSFCNCLLFVKYNNFELVTRCVIRENSLRNADDMMDMLSELLKKTDAGKRKVRLLGVSVSKLETIDQAIIHQLTSDEQLNLL